MSREMEHIEKTVFLSYRRANGPWALAIFQNLTQHGYDVFFDYTRIPSGHFEPVILGNIKASAHFLVLLTPSALDRCKEPGDWLQREIETALETHRNVVPLFLEGFHFRLPKVAEQLTGSLERLQHYHGLTIPLEYFLEAMDRLRNQFLNVQLSTVPHPPSLPARQAAQEQKAAAELAPEVGKKELTAQQWFEWGFAAVSLDEKVYFYSEAIRLDPLLLEAFNNRGVARGELGDLSGSIEDFSKAICLDPNDFEVFYNRGVIRGMHGDHVGEIEDYNEAIRLNPNYAEAIYNRGLTRGGQGDLTGAINDYSEAIRLNPNDVDTFYNRGVARDKRGDLAGAIRDFSEAIRLNPNYADAFYNRGVAWDKRGDLAGAIRDYGEAIRLNPNYTEAIYNRGWARDERGDLAGAIEDYTEVVRLNPNDADAFHNRGVAREKQGDSEGAKRDYDEAVRLGYKPEA